MDPALKTIEALLGEAIGLDPRSVGPDSVERAVRRRMDACAIDEMASYHQVLAASRAELDELVERIAVPETWFFRDPGVFDYLVEHVSKLWRPRHRDRRLRVLSLACASGEEVYSIAIALTDAGVEDFAVRGIDVRRSAVDVARAAVYPRNAFRGDDQGFRDRYFTASPDGHRLTGSLRGTISFRQGNALSPTLLSAEDPFDIVFCRNLMIYLGEQGRERLVANVDRLVRDDGLLFAGHAETELLWRGVFVSARRQQAFAFVKPASQAPESAPRGSVAHRADRRPSAGSNGHSKTGGARPMATARPAHAPEISLDRVRALADAGSFDDAVRLCEEHVARHGASAPAFFLTGVVHQAMGDAKCAELFFDKAVYLDPNHCEALLCLALLKEKRGDVAAAALVRRRAERAILASRRTNERGTRGRRP